MFSTKSRHGQDELVTLRNQARPLFMAVAAFSIVVNLLVLTGPFYMLLIYDRVLGSGSVETLVALSLIAGFLFLAMGVLDYTRGRILARIGQHFNTGLAPRVFDTAMRASPQRSRTTLASSLQDLETISHALSSQLVIALFDLPWVPVFLAGLVVFHPALALVAVAGGGILVLLALINQIVTSRASARQRTALQCQDRLTAQFSTHPELVQSLGLNAAAFRRWQTLQQSLATDRLASGDISGGFGTATKTLRILMQSAMLGMGALLVLQGAISPGVMLASSILMGRALAPIEVTLAHWPLMQNARQAWLSLAALLSRHAPRAPQTRLPPPKAQLDVTHLSVAPPNCTTPTLRMVSFSLAPGQALGVIGPSGSGKSTLARALTGYWPATTGSILLAGARYDQYGPDALGCHIGYLPQTPHLFDGTIAENIAYLALEYDSDSVIHAAQMAGAHEMILGLPMGYDTPVSAAAPNLSGGQAQRIGLARAVYGTPAIVILDEPNSNLDSDGINNLTLAVRALKAQGSAVVIMAHRPSALQECDLALSLDNGHATAFGPKDHVLHQVVANARQIKRATSA